jgi:hypothetical protein
MAADPAVCRFAAWTIRSEFPLPELPASTAAVDWQVVRDPGAASRRGVSWYQHADAADGLPWVWFGRRAGQDVVRFPGLGWCVLDQQRIGCVWRRHLVPGDPQHLLINHVLPLAASRAGLLVLHASVVVRPGGGAVAFAGPVGAGKSTAALALASRGWRVLSDDRLVVDQEPMAYPIAPYLRVAAEAARQFDFAGDLPLGHHKVRLHAGAARLQACTDRVPLERIVFMQRTNDPTRASALAGREAAAAVLRSLLQLGIDQPAVQRRVFEQVGQLTATVPITRLQIARRWERLAEIEDVLRNA